MNHGTCALSAVLGKRNDLYTSQADMDGLIELAFQFAMHWRVGLATLAATVAAVILAIAIPPFTGGFGIALVLLGFGAGLLWEGSSSRA